MNSNKTNKVDELKIEVLKNIARAAEITLIGAGRADVVLGRRIKNDGDIEIYITWAPSTRIEELAILCKRHKLLFYISPVLREEVGVLCPTVNGIGPILMVYLLPEYRS